jgi:hypothetical protein
MVSAVYSSLSAVIGDTRDARRAGTSAASAPTTTSAAAAAVIVAGSAGVTPYSWLCT